MCLTFLIVCIKNKLKQYQTIEQILIECPLCPVISEDTKVERQSLIINIIQYTEQIDLLE